MTAAGKLDRQTYDPAQRGRARVALVHPLVCAFMLAAVFGCQHPDTVSEIVEPTLCSPLLVDCNAEMQVHRFSNWSEQVHVGPGWYRFVNVNGRSSGQAWVSQHGSLFFRRPFKSSNDLVLKCRAYEYPGAPPQSVSAEVNGLPLSVRAVGAETTEVRWSLPVGSLNRELNMVEFHFAWAAVPAEVGMAAHDRRRLAARVDQVAILPSGREVPGDSENVAELKGTRLVLRSGAVASLPLPACARIGLSFNDVTVRGGDFGLEVMKVDPGTSPEPIWSGSPTELQGRLFQFGVQLGSELVLRLFSPAGSTTGSVGIDLAHVRVDRRFSEGTAPDQSPPVFVYLIDTLRADALGVYGAAPDTTPGIDAFARDAVLFENAWSGSAWTLPAVASLFTGVHPTVHGVKLAGHKLSDSPVPSLAERLGDAHYRRIAVSQSPVVTAKAGFDRGFEAFTSNCITGGFPPSSKLRWFLWQHFKSIGSETPMLVYLHAMEPHAPYEPTGQNLRFVQSLRPKLPRREYTPLQFMSRNLGEDPANRDYLRGLYQGEVAEADRNFGATMDLLKYVGLYDRSLIVVLSDHGEEFGEHGGFDHGRTLYEEMIRVPLLIKLPGGRRAGTRVGRRVSTVDVLPTILSITAQSTDDPRSLVLLPDTPSGSTPGEAPVVFSEVITRDVGIRHGIDLQAAITGSTKCIVNRKEIDQFGRPAPRFLSFDLGSDATEHDPLGSDSQKYSVCFKILHDISTENDLQTETKLQERTLDNETQEQLRALGYID